MMLATSRRILELGRYVQQGRWKRSVGEDMYGWDVHGKTLGILGYGRIGQALEQRAALGFNMPVLYHRSEEHTSELQSLMRISYAVFCLKKKTKYMQELTIGR